MRDGHEFSGEVLETGSDARMFSQGDLVTAEVTDYCGRCEMCRRGFTGHCEYFEQLGFTIPGTFAEYVAVPEKILWDVSPLGDAYNTKEEVLRAAAISSRVLSPTTACSGVLKGFALEITTHSTVSTPSVSPA